MPCDADYKPLLRANDKPYFIRASYMLGHNSVTKEIHYMNVDVASLSITVSNE